jgi:hypothetical protein
MNLSLCRNCISETGLRFSSPRIQFKAINLKNEVRELENVLHAFSENTVIVSDEAFAWTSNSECINEKYMLNLFQIIQKFKTTNINQNSSFTNLTKAITEYERGMKENSRPFIFKHLFNSLEFCTNFYKEYTSDAFDIAVSKNVAIPTESIREWRKFYSRIKHVDRSEKESMAFVGGMNKVNSMILPIRSTTRKMIVRLLNSSLSFSNDLTYC